MVGASLALVLIQISFVCPQQAKHTRNKSQVSIFRSFGNNKAFWESQRQAGCMKKKDNNNHWYSNSYNLNSESNFKALKLKMFNIWWCQCMKNFKYGSDKVNIFVNNRKNVCYNFFFFSDFFISIFFPLKKKKHCLVFFM